jgi:hypothetical protein
MIQFHRTPKMWMAVIQNSKSPPCDRPKRHNHRRIEYLVDGPHRDEIEILDSMAN